MSKRNLFSELSSALNEAKLHSEKKLTLKTHTIEVPHDLSISPEEIMDLRENFNMSSGVFEKYLQGYLRIESKEEASQMSKR